MSRDWRLYLDDLIAAAEKIARFVDGQTAAVRTGAVAAGWTEYGIGQNFRDGGWGRVNVNFKPDRSCGITVPVGGSRGKELAILDATGLWAKANGFARTQPRDRLARQLGDRDLDESLEDEEQRGGLPPFGDELGAGDDLSFAALEEVPDVLFGQGFEEGESVLHGACRRERCARPGRDAR